MAYKTTLKENLAANTYKDLRALTDHEKAQRMEAYLKVKGEYSNTEILCEGMVEHLTRSELFSVANIIAVIRKDGLEQYFLKEISIKSSIILTLLFSFYDLSYLLYSYNEAKYRKEYDETFTRL